MDHEQGVFWVACVTRLRPAADDGTRSPSCGGRRRRRACRVRVTRRGRSTTGSPDAAPSRSAYRREDRRARREPVVAVPLGDVDRDARRRSPACGRGGSATRRPVAVDGSRPTCRRRSGTGGSSARCRAGRSRRARRRPWPSISATVAASAGVLGAVVVSAGSVVATSVVAGACRRRLGRRRCGGRRHRRRGVTGVVVVRARRGDDTADDDQPHQTAQHAGHRTRHRRVERSCRHHRPGGPIVPGQAAPHRDERELLLAYIAQQRVRDPLHRLRAHR